MVNSYLIALRFPRSTFFRNQQSTLAVYCIQVLIIGPDVLLNTEAFLLLAYRNDLPCTVALFYGIAKNTEFVLAPEKIMMKRM